jgi:cell division protein FtsN
MAPVDRPPRTTRNDYSGMIIAAVVAVAALIVLGVYFNRTPAPGPSSAQSESPATTTAAPRKP